MNLLFISSRFPYPTLKGDQLIVYQRIKGLSKFFDITLLTFYTDENELNELEHVKLFCKRVIPVKLTKGKILKNSFETIFDKGKPLQVGYFKSDIFYKELIKCIELYKIDIVHSFTLRLAEFTKDLNIPVLYELIDSMELNVRNMIREEKGFKKWVYKTEYKRIKQYEQNLVKDNQYVSVVSTKDKEKIGFDHIKVIPNGVDLDIFKPTSFPKKNGRIIFTGNMGYLPNIHAVTWFALKCFPLILQAIPEAKFIIAGANPSYSVKKLHNGKNIYVTGYVHSLVDELTKSMVSVAPMRSGSGMQNKILEAMACELPVVTTHNGLEGIDAEPNEEILVADTSEIFAQSVISLLKVKTLHNKIAVNSRKYVAKNHSWELSNGKIIDMYLDAFPTPIRIKQ